MAVILQIIDKVKFKVAGEVVDGTGAAVKFDYWLVAKRLTQEEMDTARNELATAIAKDGQSPALLAKLTELVSDWSGVKTPAGEPVAYSADSFKQLLNTFQGMSLQVWHQYQMESGTKAKN